MLVETSLYLDSITVTSCYITTSWLENSASCCFNPHLLLVRFSGLVTPIWPLFGWIHNGWQSVDSFKSCWVPMLVNFPVFYVCEVVKSCQFPFLRWQIPKQLRPHATPSFTSSVKRVVYGIRWPRLNEFQKVQCVFSPTQNRNQGPEKGPSRHHLFEPPKIHENTEC